MGMNIREIGQAALTTAGDLAEALVEGEGMETPPPAPRPATPNGRRGFDRAIDALNRLPRPAAALGVLGLMLYALVDPAGFEARMQALAAMPAELWWILGGVLTFTFGAREAHYLRSARRDETDPGR